MRTFIVTLLLVAVGCSKSPEDELRETMRSEIKNMEDALNAQIQAQLKEESEAKGH